MYNNDIYKKKMKHGKKNKIIFFLHDKKRYLNILRIFYTNKIFLMTSGIN